MLLGNDPITKESLEEGRKIFSSSAQFSYAVDNVMQLPPMGLPEIAFIGRSNVGKSSLINLLTNRKDLARTSSNPGRTKQFIYFNISDRLFLVDMPGYGYAKVSKDEKEKWKEFIDIYLKGRGTLKRVMLLIDARVGIKDSDEEMCKFLDACAVVYQIILTKCDLIRDNEISGLKEDISHFLLKHPAAYPYFIETSSKKNIGIDYLRANIAEAISY